MANANGWGDGASNNNIGWGKGADNAIGWGSVYSVSEAGATDIVGTPAVDSDAQAFITAAAITDNTQKNAINTLVLALKGYSIWTKFKAIYPIVGGTASQHKFNLKDPRDLDVAYRLTFGTGWTHTANGMQSLATFANTFLNMSTEISSVNSWAVGFYSNVWVAGGVDLGADTGINNFYLTTKSPLFGATTGRFQTSTSLAYSDLTGTGFFLGSRNSNINTKVYKNGVEVANSVTVNGGTFANLNVYLGALNRSGVRSFSTNVRYAFCFIANANFNATEAANFYTAVQAFQTSLSRNV